MGQDRFLREEAAETCETARGGVSVGSRVRLFGAVLPPAAAGRGWIRAAGSEAQRTRASLAAGVSTISPSGAACNEASRRSAGASS